MAGARPPEGRRAPRKRRGAMSRVSERWRRRVAAGRRTIDGGVRAALGIARKPLMPTWGAVRGWAEPRRKWVYPSTGLVVAVGAGLLPFLSTQSSLPTWLQHVTSGAVLSVFALNVLFALGLNVVVGFAGLLDLGYVAFWAIGAYTAGILSGASRFSIRLTHIPPLPATRPTWHAWTW